MTHRTGFHDGRLGIGLEINGGGDGSGKPRYPLDINGDIRLSGAIVDSSGNPIQMMAQQRTFPNAITTVEREDIGDGTFTINGNTKISGDLQLNGSLKDSTGADRIFSNWTVHSNGNDVYRNSGNVGIGTTTPHQLLTVTASSGTNSDGIALNSNSGYRRMNIASSGSGGNGNTYFNMWGSDNTTPASHPPNHQATPKVQIHCGGNSWFNGGNVGIGTPVPKEKLDIMGGKLCFTDGQFDGDTTGISFYYGSQSTERKVMFFDGSLVLRSPWDNSAPDNSMRGIYFQQYDGTNIMFLRGDNGNVGIGTSPSYKLDVNGSINGTSLYIGGGKLIREASENDYGGIQIGYTVSGKNYPVELSSGKAYVNVPWEDTNTNTHPSDYVNFSSTQTVGGEKTFTSQIKFEGSSRTSHINYSTHDDWYIRSGSTSGTVYIQDNGGDFKVAYNTNKYCYLGRAFIGYAGHSDYAGFGHLDCASSTGYAIMQSSTGWTYLNCKTSRGICFRINDSDKMRLKSNGYFGIGTTDPAAPLHVDGATSIFSYAGDLQLKLRGGQSSSSDRDDCGISFANRYSIGNTNECWFIGSTESSGHETKFMICLDDGDDYNPDWDGNGKWMCSTSGTITNNRSWIGSDDRIKNNETNITNALDTINKLDVKGYFKSIKMHDYDHNYILDNSGIPIKDQSGNEVTKKDYDYEIGIIAQQVKTIPELAHAVHGEEYGERLKGKEEVYDESGNVMIDSHGNPIKKKVFKIGPTRIYLNYSDIFCYNIAATQELHKAQQADKAEIAELKTKVTTLESTLETVLARITELENK